MDPLSVPFLSPDLIALGPVVFAVVAFVRRLTAKQDGSYRIDGIVAVSVLSLLVSVGVVFWAFPASSLQDLVRRVPALFLLAVGGVAGLKRILGNEDISAQLPGSANSTLIPSAPAKIDAPSTDARKTPLEPPPDPPGSLAGMSTSLASPPAPAADGSPS